MRIEDKSSRDTPVCRPPTSISDNEPKMKKRMATLGSKKREARMNRASLMRYYHGPKVDGSLWKRLGFFAPNGSQRTPQSIGTLGARRGERATVGDRRYGKIAGFDRISNEPNGTITHQNVGTTLMVTRYRRQPVIGIAITQA